MARFARHVADSPPAGPWHRMTHMYDGKDTVCGETIDADDLSRAEVRWGTTMPRTGKPCPDCAQHPDPRSGCGHTCSCPSDRDCPHYECGCSDDGTEDDDENECECGEPACPIC